MSPGSDISRGCLRGHSSGCDHDSNLLAAQPRAHLWRRSGVLRCATAAWVLLLVTAIAGATALAPPPRTGSSARAAFEIPVASGESAPAWGGEPAASRELAGTAASLPHFHGAAVVDGLPGMVQTGAQRLLESDYAALAGQRVGVIANPTTLLPDLSHLVDAMAASPHVHVVAVFGPEHGFRGDHQAGHGGADHYTDNRTGLPVYSTYGREGAALEAIIREARVDCLVFDIQDVGTRFYTYIWTMWDMLQACPLAGVTRFYVLDRPNPLGERVLGRLTSDNLRGVDRVLTGYRQRNRVMARIRQGAVKGLGCRYGLVRDGMAGMV